MSFVETVKENKTPIIAGLVCVSFVIGMYYYSYGELPSSSSVFSGASSDCNVTEEENAALRGQNEQLEDDIERLNEDNPKKTKELEDKREEHAGLQSTLEDIEANLTDTQKKLKSTNKNVTIISSVFGGIAFVIFAVFFVRKLVRKYKKRQGVVSSNTVPAPVAAVTNAAANVTTAAAEAVVETGIKTLFSIPVSIITNQPNISEIIQTEHLPSLSFDIKNNVQLFHPSR